MPRQTLTARTATVDDLPVLLALWHELRQVGARAERAMSPIGLADVEVGLRRAMDDPDIRIVLACNGAEPVGMAVFRATFPDPLSDLRLLQLSHVVVSDGQRRRGVGRTLIAAGADFADELGIDRITVSVYPSLRDVSRYYARLGFARSTEHRVAPVQMLRRRLAGGASMLRIDDVVRRRSRARRPLPVQRTAARPEHVD